MKSLSKLTVSKYKSILNKGSIDIRNLTIISGANSSGKSSIIQPLLLLKQTLESQYDPGALLLDGPNVRLTHMDQFFSKKSSEVNESSFSVKLELDQNSTLELLFKREKKELNIFEMIYRIGRSKAEVFKKNMSEEEIEEIVPDFLRGFPKSIADNKKEYDPKWAVKRERCFYYLAVEVTKDNFLDLQIGPSSEFKEQIERIIHIPGLRGNPERNYKATGISDKFPGPFQHYVASIIRDWQDKKSPKLSLLNEALSRLKLTSNVSSKPLNDTQVDLRVGRFINPKKSLNDTVSIADVGLGVSQVLPVIVSLLVAKPGQIVYIEQPEIHLHPNAQAELAYILARAASNGVKIIIETHSSILLRSIQTVVAQNIIDLEPENVVFNWFKKNNRGNTKIISRFLDENGSFGDWPSDFDTTYLRIDREYLDAVEKNIYKNA